jgi:predicted ABC-type transport system involved in lysophospholipase L1 biosynthesis ATPase subunit
VNDAIQDGVGEGRFADHIVSRLDQQLAGDQRRTAAAVVFNDLHQVAALAGIETVSTPVVEDQQIGLDQGAEQLGEAPVAVRQFNIGEQPWHARVMHAMAIVTGFLRQRATEPRLRFLRNRLDVAA